MAGKKKPLKREEEIRKTRKYRTKAKAKGKRVRKNGEGEKKDPLLIDPKGPKNKKENSKNGEEKEAGCGHTRSSHVWGKIGCGGRNKTWCLGGGKRREKKKKNRGGNFPTELGEEKLWWQGGEGGETVEKKGEKFCSTTQERDVKKKRDGGGLGSSTGKRVKKGEVRPPENS